MKIEQQKCPICLKIKPENPDNAHDQVLMRTDWRKASRPSRRIITDPVGQSLMCLECHNRIRDEYSPTAPRFEENGRRIEARLL